MFAFTPFLIILLAPVSLPQNEVNDLINFLDFFFFVSSCQVFLPLKKSYGKYTAWCIFVEN